jgi:hypothetical protein
MIRLVVIALLGCLAIGEAAANSPPLRPSVTSSPPDSLIQLLDEPGCAEDGDLLR